MLSRLRSRVGRWLPATVRAPLAHWLWRELDLRFEVSGLGCRIENRSDWQALEEVFLRGVYDEAIQAAFEIADPRRPVAVLDLGAHIGLFTLRVLGATAASGRPLHNAVVFAVEGLPLAAARLGRNAESWRREGADVREIAGLVGYRSGGGTIVLGGSDLGASIHAREGKAFEVPYVDLDPVVASLPEIDLVKCDIEGAEASFVEEYGELLARTNVLVIEIHPGTGWTGEHDRRVQLAGLVPLAPAVGLSGSSGGPVLRVWKRDRVARRDR